MLFVLTLSARASDSSDKYLKTAWLPSLTGVVCSDLTDTDPKRDNPIKR
jgi:hypothetical protein